jgi:hypothetical protein
MNIHLERYKQQILNEVRTPDGDPKVDVVGVCETLVDEIGDKTLQNLYTLIDNSNDFELVNFCHTLHEFLESQLAYRNQSTEGYNDFQNQRQQNSI